MDRESAVARVEELVETVETETMPVPVRELWVYGDVALGKDPVERLDVYLTKDLLMDGDPAPDLDAELGVDGIGRTVRAEWADEFPEYVRANDSGHVAPEKCLAAHLLDDEPIHIEVCNAGFEQNVTQRLKGAHATGAYERVLDPRGVCLWVDGQRSTEAFEKLRDSSLAFPTLADSLEMLGLEPEDAETAADAVHKYRKRQEGATVRSDVV